MAQLGARFHGMEEVNGSNPFRSTKSLPPLLDSVSFQDELAQLLPTDLPHRDSVIELTARHLALTTDRP